MVGNIFKRQVDFGTAPFVYQSEPIYVLYQEDFGTWLLLPEKAFDCVRYENVKVDKFRN
ncbi:hypothetical protein GCM10012290_25500 [Halolactibacillus alkaliphilus]|uniref:Uncharacterized protein n=1 Tax=Halolactibacillus alkaliphilus TaxID=442899 RepID=A0A511X4Z7_9BACI|nr:hypothetical protein [Halolactibacillus alkaliphilus]GEN58013.1 hypothetical protein HAL01_24770 [Halolactibacillus alkaliphilus]GGN76122.1 hypothetical protein GCM10012290_25500 [Halolactibacillus alkaliphilus]SFP11041.1 hypothetical protein SAMN05720591_1506 [Halolactibacillus alkaliphilus]